MPNYTPNYELIKPLGTETFSVSHVNSNADKTDTAIKSVSDQLYQNTNQINQSLSQKATKTELNALDSAKASKTEVNNALSTKRDKTVQIVESDLSQSLRESITGGSTAVVGKESVDDVNLIEGITLKKFKDVDFEVTSKNICNPDEIVRGGYYDKDTGDWIERADYATTGYLDFEPNTSYIYVAYSGSHVTFWDKDYNFVSGLQADKQATTFTFTTPSDPNIRYMCVNVSITEIPNFTLAKGTIPAPVGYDYKYKLTDKFVFDGEVSLGQLEGARLVPTSNKFNKDIATLGGYIDYATGNWVSRPDYAETDFIAVSANQTWYKHYKSGHIVFFDSNEQYISGIEQIELNFLNIPNNPNISFMRLSVNLPYIDEVMVVQTTVAPDSYIPYEAVQLNSSFNVSKQNIADESVIYNKLDENNRKAIDKINNSYANQTLFSNQFGDISIRDCRDKKYGTSYWLMRINRNTFDGKTILPKVKLTASTVTDPNIKSVVNFVSNNSYPSVINAGIFNVATGLTDGLLISDGVILQDTPQTTHTRQYALAIKPNGDMAAFPHTVSAANILADGYTEAVVGFVPIIENFEITSDSILNLVPHGSETHPRQVIGQLANGDYIVCSFDGRTLRERGVTLKECVEILKEYNVKFAYNLDGGGSTQTFVSKKRINRLLENRPVPNVIVFEVQP